MGCSDVYDLTPEERGAAREKEATQEARDLMRKGELASALISAAAAEDLQEFVRAIDGIMYGWPGRRV